MSNEVAARLAGRGVAVPTLQTVAPQGFSAFESAGEEALAWWRRLRAESAHTGVWPVLVDPQAEALEWGEPTGFGPLPSLDDPPPDVLAKELEDWPALGGAQVSGFLLPFERWTHEAEPVLVTLVPTAYGWEVPRLIGYGDWNRCPPPDVHAATLKRWHERFGVDLVCLTRTGLELGMARPPRTREQALTLAWDFASYCYDSVDAIYQADTLAELAAGLIDADVVRCWWD